MPPTEDVTLGELNRKLDSLTGSVQSLTDKLDNYPRWPDVQRIERQWQEKLDAAVAQRETVTGGITQRIADLESWQTWAARIIIGLVIAGVITAFFVFKP